MVIMGIIMGALVGLFTSGVKSESNMNFRFQAQSNARNALDVFRNEVHNACNATVTSTSVTLKTIDSSLTTYPCTQTSATWCTTGSGSRYALRRETGVTCTGGSTLRADYLTGGSIFSLVAATNRLTRLGIDMTVNVQPTESTLQYRLDDNIAMRNLTRT